MSLLTQISGQKSGGYFDLDPREKRTLWIHTAEGHGPPRSIPLDTLIFTIVAFAGVFSWGMIWSIVWGDIVAKTAIGTIFAFLRGYEIGRESIR